MNFLLGFCMYRARLQQSFIMTLLVVSSDGTHICEKLSDQVMGIVFYVVSGVGLNDINSSSLQVFMSPSSVSYIQIS